MDGRTKVTKDKECVLHVRGGSKGWPGPGTPCESCGLPVALLMKLVAR